MPRTRRKQPGAIYYVLTALYASEAVKAQLESSGEQVGQLEHFESVPAYVGPSERRASWAFYQSCKAARANPLALAVVMYRGNEVVTRVVVEH